MNRITLTLGSIVFVFCFILLAQGLYLLFGDLVVYAAAAAIVVGALVYLADVLTERGSKADE
jgi:hypothetical protein